MKDKLVRLLADMENLRERSARQVESAHKFAIQVCVMYSTYNTFAVQIAYCSYTTCCSYTM